jgi:protein O-GlcNAc transferase
MQDLIQRGLEQQRAGNLPAAASLYRQVLAIQADQPDALHLLGIVTHQLGDAAAAIEVIRRSIQARPGLAPFHNNLANILKRIGRLDEAVTEYERALVLQPNLAEARLNLATTLNDLGTRWAGENRLDQAERAYRRAVELGPDFADAWSNLGDVLATLHYVDDAIDACNRALELRPDFAIAHNNLANALRSAGRSGEAVAHYRRALELDPKLAPAYSNLGNALSDQGKVAEAEQSYRQALALDPNPNVHSNLLYHLLYCDHPPELIYQEHRQFDEVHARQFASKPLSFANSLNPDRRLKIGYVSADFRRHSVNYFVEPFLSHHDHQNFQITCYADERWADKTTDRLRSYCDGWRKIDTLDDAQLAALINNDGIDILVDLAGHTVGNRLLAFARQPAPLGVTYLGYPATTGLSAIHYRFTDALADPPGVTDPFHSERLVRLTNCFLCYRISDDLPAVSPLPSARSGVVTFGCFNNFAKLSSATLDTWSGILQRVPAARLLLKFRSLGDPDTQKLALDAFTSRAIAADRIMLLPHTNTFHEHLDLYRQIDIALDPFPYNGTTTTCEALAMGLPVVTLAGRSHVSRVGVSILTNLGMPELIAQNKQQYVEIACALTGDLSRLSEMRANLRQRMRQSPLCEEITFTRNLETAYREIWRTHCQLRA